MSKVMEYLSGSVSLTKRELVLGAIASLMTGVVIGTYASRPKHPRHLHGAPECPPPPMPPHGPEGRPPMPPRKPCDSERRTSHDSEHERR